MTRGREGSTTSSATPPPHVVLCDPPVTFARAEAPDDPSGAGSSGAPAQSRFFFDEANDWVIAHEETVASNEEDDDATTAARLRCHPLPPRGLARRAASRVPPRPVSIRVPKGPALDARVSPQWKPGLDRRDFRVAPRLVAIKRSDVAIDVYRVDVDHDDDGDDADDGVARGGHGCARYELRRAGERILFFFWSLAPGVDLVVVTTRGLEQYACAGCWDVPAEDDDDDAAGAGGGASRAYAEGEAATSRVAKTELALAPVGEKRMKGERPVGWCAYDVDSKLVMLGSGPGHARLNAWQFSAAGAIKLPRFELPRDAAGAAGEIDPASPRDSSATLRDGRLRGEDVRLFTLYGRVFLAVADRPRGELALHRVHRDALVKERVVNLSPLLLYTEGALPRGVRLDLSVVDNVLCVHAAGSGLVSAIDVAAVRTSTSSNNPNGGDDDGVRSGDLPVGEAKPLGSTPCRLGGAPADVRGLTFVGADVVVDVATGRAWKLALDLRAASDVAGGGASGGGDDVAASVAFLQRRSQAPWAGDVGFGDDRGCARETAPTATLTRRGAATPPFSPPFSPPASPTPRRRVVPSDALSDVLSDAIDDADESPRALTIEATRRALDRGDHLGTLRSVFVAVCGSYVEARSRGAALTAGARFRASFRARGGEDLELRSENDPDNDPENDPEDAPEPHRRPSSPSRRELLPASSPAVSPSDAYALVFRPHVHALLADSGVLAPGGCRSMRRSLRAARAAVVEYLLAAEQTGAAREFGAGARSLSSSSGYSPLRSSRGVPRGVAMCARLCVAASVALGEKGLGLWEMLLADAADDDDRDANAAAGSHVERRAGRGTAATVRIPGGDGQSPAEVFASLAGRPVRLAAAHRRFEETSPGSLRGTPLGAKYRRAFDPDGGADDGDGDGDGEGTGEEEDRGEVRPGDASSA